MLIRSQDKKSLINFDRITATAVSLDHYIVMAEKPTESPNNILPIAKYSTEAKAIKVLDMICDAYELCERTDYQNIGYVGNGVFQMPLDAEVEG